jgi:hypothetical protein
VDAVPEELGELEAEVEAEPPVLVLVELLSLLLDPTVLSSLLDGASLVPDEEVPVPGVAVATHGA